MENTEDNVKSPVNLSKKQPEITDNVQETVDLFSPRFRSVAAMAGWDEEALLLASLTVEDTPDTQCKHRKRRNSQIFRTSHSSSRRKRRARKRNPASMPITVLDLDSEDANPKKQDGEKMEEIEAVGKKCRDDDDDDDGGGDNSKHTIPCLDRLREELSCAICLEICYEPSTTPCGHSFCKKCLRSAADRCGKKCPKCRQLISNGKHCTVNTVLWNTIQLLFPEDVQARKSAPPPSSDDLHEPQPQPPPPPPQRGESRHHSSRRSRFLEALYISSSPESESTTRQEIRDRAAVRNRITQGFVRVRESLPSQDEDAALALRLQREEFMVAYRAPPSQQGGGGRNYSTGVARANLRAMASRAVNIRIRDRRG